MWHKSLCEKLLSLQLIMDWVLMPKLIEMLCGDFEFGNYDKFTKLYND